VRLSVDVRFEIQGLRYKMQNWNSLFCVLSLVVRSSFVCILCLIIMSCILCTAKATAAEAASMGAQVLEMLPDGLVVEFQMPELKTDIRTVAGQTLQLLSFNGCSFTHEVGKSQIPIRVVSLGIPDASEPIVSIVDAKSSLLSGYRLYPVENPVIRRKRDAQNAMLASGFSAPSLDTNYTVESEFAMDEDFYKKSRFYPSVLAAIKPMGYIRQQRIARLQFHPIQYNPATGQLRIYKKLVVRVRFAGFIGPARTDISQYSGGGDVGAFEDLYQNVLLNYEQARNWRTPRQSIAALAPPQMTTASALETRYKLSINKTGIYRLDYSYLKSNGIDPGTIDPRKVEIQSGGDPVPIYIEGYDDGVFDPGDYIEFYAVKIDSVYTDTNVYWLSWGSMGSSGSRLWMMTIKDGTPRTPGLVPPVAFRDTEHWEEINTNYDPLREMKSEDVDHFFWSYMRGQDPQNNRRGPIKVDLPFRAPNMEGLVKLRVCFQGLTYDRGASSHKVEVSLNGIPVDTAEWEGQAQYITETILDQTDLHRYNHLSLYCQDDNGTYNKATSDPRYTGPKWDVFLNWIEIYYWREFAASANILAFSTQTVPPVTKKVQYILTRFSSPNIEIFQISGNGAIAKIANPEVQRDGSYYTATFEDRVEQPTQYFASARTALMRPTKITKDESSTLHDPANRIDHVMITHKDFRQSTERLADFRRDQGLAVMVVDIEDVYDEFSYGVFDPKAIQRFLRYAYFNWDKEPTYVLLVGDAHWDYKYYFHEYYTRYDNYPRIYVPTYHAWGEPWGQTAMDHRFVTISGDDKLPDMFIGRIPAETAEEADRTVDKIIEYESKPNLGIWQSRILLAADDKGSKSGDEVFENSRVELVDSYIPVGYETIDVYLGRLKGADEARTIIKAEANKGVVILEYAGHGGAYSWADEFMFSIDDVKKLRNYNKYPFVVTTTCQNGYFDSPMGGNKCIIEQFLLQPRTGAVACLSATRLTYGQGNASFDKILYPKFFNNKSPILGRIISEAKIEYINLDITTWIPAAEQYTLFGDPATRLALPELDIECEIAESSVDSSKKLELEPGAVKRTKLNPLTGEESPVTDTGFNAQMQISVVHPNNMDENRANDLPVQIGGVNVWKGEFGRVLLSIPPEAIPGEGRLRCFANSGNSSAIGGIRFSVSKPVIEFHSSQIVYNEDNDDEGILKVHAAVVDNLGPGGIESVVCKWQNTETWKKNYNNMIPGDPPPGAPEIKGSWYELESDIPLSRPGTSIEYEIIVTDTEGNEVSSPSQKIRVPIGVNFAISQTAASLISYSYSLDEGAWILSAPVENNGGKEVKLPVAVYFFEGNPDRNRDNKVDPDVEILGATMVEYSQWKPGEHAIQTAVATVKLEQPLYSGFHQIFVWINPNTDRYYNIPETERLEDANRADDKASRLFQINEFLVGKGDEPTTAQSLDGTLSMVIPPDAVDETVMSIARFEPPAVDWNQPDLSYAPIPGYESESPGSAFKIQLASGSGSSDSTETTTLSLRKEAQIDIKFDAMKIRELAKELKGLSGKMESELSNAEKEWIELAYQEEASKLGIYSWQEDIEVWRYVPSSLLMGDSGMKFAQNPYVTFPVNENRSDRLLTTDHIIVDELITPIGHWVIFFLDSSRYKLYLRREGMDTYESFGYGELNETYYNNYIGLTLKIPGEESESQFGDIHNFNTYQDLDGAIILESLRSYNAGDGTARVVTMKDDTPYKVHHVAGEWAIFFTDSMTYEVHSQNGFLVKDNIGYPIKGEIGKNIIIPTIGVEIEVNAGREQFQFGDKFVFRTLFTGTVQAQMHDLNTITLMHSSDYTRPIVQVWINRLIPQDGEVIPPRPAISLLLSDANGIDIDSLSFSVSINDRDFRPVPPEDYVFSDRSKSASFLTNVPMFYSPILDIGKYRYRVAINDLCGNKARADDTDIDVGAQTSSDSNADEYIEFMFLVEEQPDLDPPVISVTVDDQTLTSGQIFNRSPELIINIDDNYQLDPSTIILSFAQKDEQLEPLLETQYFLTVAEDSKSVIITYFPHLINGDYAMQIEAADTTENRAYLTPPGAEPLWFSVDEEVKVDGIMNAPNPFQDTTVFTYSLTQPADKVTIKIYSLTGRLLRNLEDDPGWQYNEKFWDGRDENGVKLASGVYLYKFIVTDADRKIEKIGKLAIIR